MANTVANLTAVLSMNNSNFKKGLTTSQTMMKNFQRQILNIGPSIAAAFSVGAIIQFGRSAVRAFDDARKAEASLSTALGGRILLQERLINQAKELQGVTLYEDDETVKAMARVALFIKEEALIKRLIPLIQDLATAKGMDLSSAADAVTKAVVGSSAALQKQGFTIEGVAGSSKRAESVIRALETGVGGQAKAAADADVSLTALKNDWNNFAEWIGGVGVGAVMSLADAIRGVMNPALLEAQQKLERTNELLREWEKRKEFWESGPPAGISSGGLFNTSFGGAATRGVASPLWGLAMTAGEKFGPQEPHPDFIPSDAGEGLVGYFGGMSTTLPFINKEFETLSQALFEVASAQDEILEGDEQWEAYAQNIADAEAKALHMSSAMTQMGKDIKNMLIYDLANGFQQLGRAVTDSMYSAEMAIQSLGEVILANLGNILIMAGMETGNWYLVVAGAIVQLASGIIQGLSANDILESYNVETLPTQVVNFKISGNDLVGTMERNAYKNTQLT